MQVSFFVSSKSDLHLPIKTHQQYCNFSYVEENFSVYSNFTPSTNVIQRKSCNQNINRRKLCWIQLKLFKIFLFSSDAGTKMVVPLLHCRINDALIHQVSYTQNMLTRLINVLDSIFVQVYNPLLWNLLRIPCDKNYYYYYHFDYMQQLLLSISQVTMATYYWCGGQSHNWLCQIIVVV